MVKTQIAEVAGRLTRMAVIAFIGLVFAMTAAHAQFAELNPNDPAGYNSDFNSSSTASGTISDVGTGGGPGGWNSAQFDFDFGLAGTATWDGGVEFQLQDGVQQLWNQPRNTNFPNNVGTYVMRFTRGVGGLTFFQGGLDNGDTVRIRALYQGAPVTLQDSYFDSFTGAVSLTSNDGTSAVLVGPSGGSGNERLREYRVTFPDTVLVDRIEYIVGKDVVNNATVTLAFYLFDWLPLSIDAEDDVGPTVPVGTAATNVLNVLEDNGNGPDTLDDPNTPAVDVATASTVTVAATGVVPAGITLNADGTIDVAATTPIGSYSIPYEICEIANPTNCATATATLAVAEPDPVFNGGSGPVSSCTATTLTTTALLSDDGGSYDGGTVVSYADAAGSGVAVTFTKLSGSDSAGGSSAPFYAAAFPDPVRGLWLGSDDRFAAKNVNAGLDSEDYRITFSPAIPQATLDFTALNFNIDGDERIEITGINGSPATSATNFQFTGSGDVVFNTATGRIEGGSSFTAAGADGGSLVIDDPAGISAITFRRIELDNVGSSLPTPNRNRSNGVVLGPFSFCPPGVPPVAQDDLVTDLPSGIAATLNPLADNGNGADADADGVLDATTVVFTGTGAPADAELSADGKTLTVPDEGVWTIAASGEVTFTPAAGFTANPTPAAYTVNDDDGNTSNEATITLEFGLPVIAAENDDFTSTPVTGLDGGDAGNVLTNDTINTGPVDPALTTILVNDDGGLTDVTIADDGTLTAPANTPPGTYTVTYQLCEDANADTTTNPATGNCDTATATVQVDPPVVVANEDDFTGDPINGADGGNAGNVLTNDTFNGGPVDPALTTILINDDGGLTGVTIADDGTLTVPPGTPAGPYTITYQLCDDANADTTTNPATGNCDTATVTVQVDAPEIVATNDDFSGDPINGADGGDAGNVLTNDTLNGVAVDPALTTILINDDGGLTGVTIADDGTVSVPPGTPAGPYTVTYQLCEDANADTSTNPATGNCDTATVTLQVDPPEIEANNDDFTGDPVNGADGGTAGNVLTNDTLNGVAVDPALTTILINDDGGLTGVTIDDDGTVTVPAGTPAGPYMITYQLCEDANADTSTNPATGNCDTATVEVQVDAPEIVANNDDFSATPVTGFDGGTAGNVLTNDTLNSDPVDPALTTILINDDGGLTGVTIADDGTLTVPPGAPAGPYTITYQLCEDLNADTSTNPATGNCDTATVTVQVDPPQIAAVDNNFSPFPINSFAGGDTASVLGNDSYNNDPLALDGAGVPTEVTLVPGTPPVTPAQGSLSMNPDGTITIAPGTTAGTYTFPYEICDDLNPLLCSEAEATVVVDPPRIDALAEPAAVVPPNTGGTALNVLASDTINDVAATPANVTISLVSTEYFVDGVLTPPGSILGGVTLDTANGNLDVDPASQAFRAQVTYQICDVANPLNCDTAIETVLVPPLELEALPETYPPVSGLTGGTLADPVIASDLSGDGVGAPVPVNLTPGDTFEVTIREVAIINKDTGEPSTAVSLDTDTGLITVDPNTPAGEYGVTYEICLVQSSPQVCRELEELVNVTAPVISAVPDTVSDIDGNTGADDVLTVYENDTLADVPITAAQITNGDITLAVITPAVPVNGAPVPVLDPADGTVDVPAGTPAGTYEIVYEVCEALNTYTTPDPGNTNCAVTTATVVVDLPDIAAVDDDFSATPINGADGGSVGSIFDTAGDDTLDGVALSAADIADGTISLALETPPASINGGPVPTLDLTSGAVAVPEGTPAGTYSFDYTICDTVNTTGAETNCDTATVTVVVAPPEIIAVPDSIADIDGSVGAGNVLSVAGNDTLNGVLITPADLSSGDVTISVVTPATPIGGGLVPVLDPVDGTVDVPAGTPQGTYVITYEICDTLNTFGSETNCATTTATVAVLPDPPVATDDVVTGLPTNTPAVVNPLVDNGNGPDSDPDGELDPTTVVFTGTGAPDGFDLSADGKTLTVPDEGVWTIADTGVVTFTPADGFAGDPTPATYTVNDNDANTSNEATITLDFDQAAPVAVDDDVPGVPGVPTVVDVLGNDTDPDDDIDPTRVAFVDPAATDSDMDGDLDRLEVTGEGVWTIDPDTGAITFTAEPAFTGNPTPVQYTVTDSTDLTSDPASVTITYPATGTGISGIAFSDNDASGGGFDPAIDTLLSGIIVELRDPDGNLIAETVTDGDGFYEMTDFAVGEDFVLSFIDPDTSEVLGTIPDLDFAIGTVLSDQDIAIVPSVPIGALQIAKNALIRDVVIGGTAPFEIIVTNSTAVEVGPVTVRDNLPVGLVYTPETATVDGIATEPDVEGRVLTFTDVLVPPNGTVTITLQTRVTSNAPNGDIVNSAVVIDPDTGIAITSNAEATIRRRPEAVFNCSDVIGKVFDDRNMDGYQNPPADRTVIGSRGPIVDFDAPLTGKFGGDAIETELTGEPGLAGVRVVTPTGTIITTDQYGRFSVPCAELPGSIGTNFALKVDTRSLPTGYRMTTDNPLVMRLTAGNFAEMNFGAAIGRVVGIDLTAAAYQPGTDEPVERLEQGIAALLEQVRDTPSIIRLSYFANGETDGTTDARLDAVEQLITDRWAVMGRYRLVIERTTKQMQ